MAKNYPSFSIMSQTCKTVKIAVKKTKSNPQGYVVINESDLKKSQRLYKEPKKK